MNFGNIVTAMVTPFQDNEMIDYQQVRTLIAHVIENGTDSIVVSGTTGESSTLTTEEKIELFSFAKQEADGRISVIAGTGSNNTAESIALTKEAEKAGVDGIMLVAPYYNKPSQAGMIAHFETIAASTSLPIMLYNIPGRSGVQLDLETIIHLSNVPNIVSIKDASGDLIHMSHVCNLTSDDFSLYCGDDGLTLPSLSVGATGVVSVASHVIGSEMQEMVQSYKDGDVNKARNLHNELLPIMEALFAAPSPAPVKAVLDMQGVPVGSVRLPLLPLTEEERATLAAILK